MRARLNRIICFLAVIHFGASLSGQAPPFAGTIFIDADIILPTDSSSFKSISYDGVENRLMFDRRVNNWITVPAHLIQLEFDDGMHAEIQVNAEFDSTSAMDESLFYAWAIGQLPAALRKDLESVWIHRGVQLFGGGNNNILIHTGQGQLYERDGILEETLVHEAAHTSLDADHARSAGWLTAQSLDPTFISTYARDFPDREDIAESFLPYLAIRYRRERISEELIDQIESAIPNRIAYFDGLDLDMYPVFEQTTNILEHEYPGEPLASANIFPNPSSDIITVEIRLKNRGDVSLDLLGLDGSVRQLQNGRRFTAGTHRLEFEVSGPDGFFFLRLSVNGRPVSVSKVVVTK
jgi:hypothetical protein